MEVTSEIIKYSEEKRCGIVTYGTCANRCSGIVTDWSPMGRRRRKRPRRGG